MDQIEGGRSEGGRVITLDPWRCMAVHIQQSKIKKPTKDKALAFLNQAEEFYRAGSDPRVASKPLLYYYSFLNLVKTSLTLKSNLDLDHCIHGLTEPRSNVKKRLLITSQQVRVSDQRQGSNTQIYREFVQACGFSVPSKPKPMKIVDLLQQVVNIDRVTARNMGRAHSYVPIDTIEFLHDPRSRTAWVSLSVEKGKYAGPSDFARRVRDNSLSINEVEQRDLFDRDADSFRYYESTNLYEYQDSPIEVLGKAAASIWKDIWSEVIPGGYRFWLSSISHAKRLAQLASAYQVMFYLGSMTRYRPHDFQKLADGKHGWMIHEFLSTQPIQFVYFCGSDIINAEMAPPELVIQ
ncbi:MAG: YaaC family protein [Phycisphaeraceae bacterium]